EGDNLLIWIATINGPAETVYQGLAYKLKFEFPLTYPYKPPTVRFETTCFHPNVDMRHGSQSRYLIC
ncbi:ubiquitin-conjugating enzyme/RWD-like protein, partial [Globomyces pollinis-pini]